MARSGSYDFTRTQTQIITRALRLCGVASTGETVEASELSDASEALEAMTKAWQSQGIHLWKEQEGTLFVEDGTASYSLGPTGTHATKSFTQTTLSVAAENTDTTITVTSATDITDTYNIGIVLDDDTIHWTTVDGAPAGTTVTLSDALDGDASSGNRVYVYESKLQRPLRILSLRRRDTSNIDTRLDLISRDEYFELTNKLDTGAPVQAYYDPQLDNGKLYLWPAPDTVDWQIRFTFLESFQDWDSTANEGDFPQEWIEALTYNLAVRLAPEYGLPSERFALLKSEAGEYLGNAMMFDNEPESFSMEPQFR